MSIDKLVYRTTSESKGSSSLLGSTKLFFIFIVIVIITSIILIFTLRTGSKNEKYKNPRYIRENLETKNYCPIDCGKGVKIKKRSKQEAKYGGKSCPINSTDCPGGTLSEDGLTCIIPCDKGECCRWGPWKELQPCNAKCGGGTKVLKRDSNTGGSCKYDPSDCPGGFMPADGNGTTCIVKCNTQPCPQNCEWGSWKISKPCEVSCGGGTEIKTRDKVKEEKYGGTCRIDPKDCENGTIDDGGKRCTAKCNTQPCAQNCVWGPWSNLSSCNHPCETEGGEQVKTRTKVKEAKYGGSECGIDSKDCPGGKLRNNGTECVMYGCGKRPCPIVCEWGAWSNLSQCNVPCGTKGGKEIKTRSKIEKKVKSGESKKCKIEPKDCSGGTLSVDGTTCTITGCGSRACAPVDCKWSSWSEYGECSQPC